MPEPKWNREGWATAYSEAEVEGARKAFDDAMKCEAFAKWYATIERFVTKTTPASNDKDDVRDNQFVLYFEEIGNLDPVHDLRNYGWVQTDRIAGRTVYSLGDEPVNLVGAENVAIIVGVKTIPPS